MRSISLLTGPTLEPESKSNRNKEAIGARTEMKKFQLGNTADSDPVESA